MLMRITDLIGFKWVSNFLLKFLLLINAAIINNKKTPPLRLVGKNLLLTIKK